MMPSFEARPLASRMSILLLLIASLFGVSCASIAGRWSALAPPNQPAGRSRVVPGDWTAVETLPRGVPIVVTLNNGGRIRGTFNALRPTMLEVRDHQAQDSAVTRSEIAKIVLSGASDTTVNGALIGAGIGLAAAGIVLGAIGFGDGYLLPSSKWGAPLLMSAAGGLLGIIIDRAHRDELLLYEAVRAKAEPDYE